jgi:acetolactate synthase I/II/III large subunit
MKVSDYIAKYIEKKGVKCVFEITGGMITHLLDSFLQHTDIKIVTVHHEQAAAFAADACGRVTGIPGVAMATSGPGATNLLTGIGSCYFDSSPAVFITGQVNRHEQKGDRNIRQLGFQETDIVSMAQHITKRSYLVNEPNDIPAILKEAFEIAVSGRPGPVLIDIPMDVQRADIEVPAAEEEPIAAAAVPDRLKTQLEELTLAIKDSKKPLLLVGRGVRASFSAKELEVFIKNTGLPVITSLLAVDALPFAHPQRVGFIGAYGNRWANLALGESDLLVVVGSRLDIRQTGADVKFFEDRKIFHVDCEEAEINNRVKGCTPIVADVKEFLTAFNSSYTSAHFTAPAAWVQHIAELKASWPDIKEVTTVGINPNLFMHQLSQHSAATTSYTIDVGAHQMWAAQSLEMGQDQLFITSAGMGAMGYALPAAVGASFAMGCMPVTAIIGDGSMQLNIQELQTIVRNNLPIKIIVMNNQSLGMIRQFQDSYFGSRYQSTWWGYTAPDFEKVSIAYGIDAKTIESEDQIADAAKWLWSEENVNKPQLLQVMIDPHTNTYPKIAFGKPLTEMEPFSKPIAMEGT